ncbi:hypothetical protein R3P38DRAFT_2766750 [Favolaschia claudopus]|uniref:Uncharacterized protein n=1 Tax=Favolaschia claudopus TaxID=2862362 RepID=A0AAW0CZM2_9AGAR
MRSLRVRTNSERRRGEESAWAKSGNRNGNAATEWITCHRSELLEDVKGDGHFGLSSTITLEALDAADDALKGGGVTVVEREASIDVEGTNGGEVAFNCAVETRLVFTGEVSGPRHESDFGCWKELPRDGVKFGMESHEVEE